MKTKCRDLSYLSALSSWMTESWSLAGGKAPVTKVEKLFSSHFRISQQFFRDDTPGSLVDKADWLLGQNNKG